MFKRIAHTAGLAGLLAAVLLTLLQLFWVTPLILEAETYEQDEPAVAHQHGDGAAHVHETEAWSPEDGWQRTLSTSGSNLVVAVGFALMLAGLYALKAPLRAREGLAWGAAGFIVFNLAPAAGLPPELPGTAAADLLLRQYWWAGTAGATAVGLALLVFARHWALRVGALLLIAVPHVIGAPQPEVHESLAPAHLERQFVFASLVTNALFWLALGAASAWLFSRPAPEAR